MDSGLAPPSPTAHATLVKALARELGFHLVGITTAEPFPEAEARVLRWLAEGRQGEMAWLTPERARLSARPRELLPGAQSCIALGVSYRQPSLPEPAEDNA